MYTSTEIKIKFKIISEFSRQIIQVSECLGFNIIDKNQTMKIFLHKHILIVVSPRKFTFMTRFLDKLSVYTLLRKKNLTSLTFVNVSGVMLKGTDLTLALVSCSCKNQKKLKSW